MNIIDTTVSGNSAGDDGGGVWNSGTLNITNSTFTSNKTSYDGGAIENFSGGTVTIAGSTFTGNKAIYGGVSTTIPTPLPGSLDIANSNFSENSGSVGGAVYSNLPTQIRDSIFHGNSATFAGGGIFSNGRTEHYQHHD